MPKIHSNFTQNCQTVVMFYKHRDLALLETWARYWQKSRVKRRQNSLHVYPRLNPCIFNQPRGEFDCLSLVLGSLSKPRERLLQNKNVKWQISPSSEQHKRRRPIFRIFIWNWTLSLHVEPEHVFRAGRAIGELNRSRQLQILLVK